MPKGNGRGKGSNSKGSQKLPDTALVDNQGRLPCYAFIHGRCQKGDGCDKYHGPETPAMRDKRKVDEKRIADRKAAAAATNATASPGNSSATATTPADKAAAKAKAKAAGSTS